MINVVEALPIKAQVSLLLTLLFLCFVLLFLSVVKRFSSKLGNLGPKCDNVCAVFIKSFINAFGPRLFLI
jgi:hypothetical protein